MTTPLPVQNPPLSVATLPGLTFSQLSRRGAFSALSELPIDADVLLTASMPLVRSMTTASSGWSSDADGVAWCRRMVASEPLTIVAASDDADLTKARVLCVAVVREYANTQYGARFQIESMATDEQFRSRGIGKAMMSLLYRLAASRGSTAVVCQSDTLHYDASRFFMAQRMFVRCFAFLGPAQAKIVPTPKVSPTSASSSPTDSPQSPASPSSGRAIRRIQLNEKELLSPECESLLRAAESVHRQLRPNLAPGTDVYLACMQQVLKDGARMLVAIETQEGDAWAFDATADRPLVALGVGVYRYYVDFTSGRKRNWVDDLVTDANRRSTGVGKALLDVIKADTVQEGVENVQLDSGVQRRDAHRFYFREQFIVDAFSFAIDFKQDN